MLKPIIRTTNQTLCLLALLSCLSGTALSQEDAGDEIIRPQDVKQALLDQAAAITLPENPTREQCRTYLDALEPVSRSLNAMRSHSRLIPKLAEFPAEHADLLVDVTNTLSHMNNTPIRKAARARLRALGADQAMLRPLLVANLENTPSHIQLIVMYGWTEEFREQIIEKVLASEDWVDPHAQNNLFWFAAAVELGEPNLYKKLHELTVNGKRSTLSKQCDLLEALPDYDLASTLRALIQEIESGRQTAWKEIDPVTDYPPKLRDAAARNGDIDALGKMISDLEKVDKGDYTYPWLNYSTYRLPVIKLINYRGSNSEIQAWFKKHKDKLVFDGFTGRYVVGDDDF